MTEVWKDVYGYEGLYQVSDLGRVKSLERKIVSVNGRSRRVKEIILKQHVGSHGHQAVGIWKENCHKVVLVHALVASAFIGVRPTGFEICHGDGNRENNKLSNLRYDTVSENRLDTVRHGRSKIHLFTGSGEKNPNAKLTEAEVMNIKIRISDGETLKSISRKYPRISYSLIKRIGQGKVWTHLEVA